MNDTTRSITWTFPMECPDCHEHMAFPESAGSTIERLMLRVALRCRACQHEWFVTVPTRRPPAATQTPYGGVERRRKIR